MSSPASYHLYALAVIAHFDRAWVESHREAILLFARDFANPSTDDRFFPAWRNKDWYAPRRSGARALRGARRTRRCARRC